MGLDPNQIPIQMRRYLPGAHPMSKQSEMQRIEKEEERLEGEMHRKFSDWLHLNEIEFVHSRTDRKSTIEVGFPDFEIAHPKHPAIFVEFKNGSNTLDEDQERVIGRIRSRGFKVLVSYSVGDAIGFVKRELF